MLDLELDLDFSHQPFHVSLDEDIYLDINYFYHIFNLLLIPDTLSRASEDKNAQIIMLGN